VLRLVRRSSDEPGAVRWDPDAGSIDAGALEGIDGFVHLAGEGIADKRWDAEQKRRILDSRTNGTDLIARTLAALERKPSVLVSASAIGIYGNRGDEVLTETSPPGQGFLADVVVAWEKATAPAADAGIRVATARTGIVLSAEGGALAKQLLPFKLGLGGRLGSGEQWWSWITIADEVGALRWLLERDVTGPVNLTAPGAVTNAAFTKALGRALHRPTFLPTPSVAPRLLLGRELADELLYGSQRVAPAVLTERGYPFQHTDIDGALRAVLNR
jgi:uncharacterized protein (TIGR01777 family)